MSFYFELDLSPVERDMDKLKRLPGRRGKRILDNVLDNQTEMVQVNVHVETGSLKSTIRNESKLAISKWTGTISAGGPSLGVNNPVDYAIYEKRRGGDHDFMKIADKLHYQYINAIRRILDD